MPGIWRGTGGRDKLGWRRISDKSAGKKIDGIEKPRLLI
jgi:hypothetical protein